MKRKMFLTVATVAVAAVSARAQAQVTTAPAGQAYTIINNVSASAVNTVTYQWYRDNNPISGATSASYTVPKTLAYGDNVQFYRLAKTEDCTGDVEKKSNTITITFTGYVMPDGCKLVVGGVCWADAHIDALHTFAARADMYTKYYQWNRLTALSTTDSVIPAWNSTPDLSETWTANPCPTNWRLPSSEEFQQLHNSGTAWADANTRGNAVAGRFYGYNHATCTLPSNMQGCVFFPASGYRANTNDELGGRGTNGRSWSSMQFNSTSAYILNFTSTSSKPADYSDKANAFPIRCVR